MPAGLAKQKLVQRLADEGHTVPDLENVKPASNQADYTSVAALLALREGSTRGFQYMSGFWVGQLLSCGLVFHQKLTDTYFISLGFETWAGLSWEIKAVENAPGFFQVSEANLDEKQSTVRLQFFTTSSLWSPSALANDEDFAGVPTRVCFFLANVVWWCEFEKLKPKRLRSYSDKVWGTVHNICLYMFLLWDLGYDWTLSLFVSSALEKPPEAVHRSYLHICRAKGSCFRDVGRTKHCYVFGCNMRTPKASLKQRFRGLWKKYFLSARRRSPNMRKRESLWSHSCFSFWSFSRHFYIEVGPLSFQDFACTF